MDFTKFKDMVEGIESSSRLDCRSFGNADDNGIASLDIMVTVPLQGSQYQQRCSYRGQAHPVIHY